MANETLVTFKKKDYNSATDGVNGYVVFDNATKKIFVGGQSFSSDVKNITYDTSTKILTITKSDTTTIQLNFNDATSASQPTSLIGRLRDDVNLNANEINTLKGTGNGSVAKTVNDAIGDLDSSVEIATKTNDIVTIKSSVVETDGTLSNAGSSEINLSKVASTGSSSDVSVTYASATENVQNVITDIDSRLTSLASNQLQYIVPSSNNTTPQGYSHYYNGNQRYQGNLAASANTMNRVYVCRTTNGGDYHQIITVKSASGNTYSWIDLGSEAIDLSGYIKSITVNGNEYTVTGTGTVVTLMEVITTITGENDIVSGNTDFVSIIATPGTASGGQKNVALTSKLKMQDIATATAQNNGLASSKDIRDYVQNNLTVIRTWSDNDIVNS